MKRIPLLRHFNWRALLMRFLVNFFALLFTVGIIPHVAFKGPNRPLTWVIVAAGLGILNAFVKPILQLIMLRFIFVSYGLVVVLINSLMLWLLSVLFHNRFVVDKVFWALIAGAVLGILSNAFENLLGLAPPILADPTPLLREEMDIAATGPLELLVRHDEPDARLVASEAGDAERRETTGAAERHWPPLGPVDDPAIPEEDAATPATQGGGA